VTVTTNGKAALELLNSGKRFDIILCDVMMPELTGMDVYDQINALDPAQSSRMVFMTGGAYTPASKEFLEHLAGRWFEKPCDIQKLRELVRSHVK
jgi:CheY-like chemotaxis protein